MARCTASKAGHNTPTGAAKCPACRKAPKPNMVTDAPTLSPEQWNVRKVLSLPTIDQKHAAMDEDQPDYVLHALAKRTSPDVRAAVANNPSAHPSTLVMLMRSNHDGLSLTVARNPNCPGSLLTKIAQTEDVPWMRVRLEEILATRMESDLGVARSNSAAREALLAMPWWTMTPESEEVQLALLLHRNQ